MRSISSSPIIGLAPLLALLLVSAAVAAPPKSKSSALAMKLTSELAHHQYEAVYAHFDAAMKSAMTPAKLADVWKMLNQKVGKRRTAAFAQSTTRVLTEASIQGKIELPARPQRERHHGPPHLGRYGSRSLPQRPPHRRAGRRAG